MRVLQLEQVHAMRETVMLHYGDWQHEMGRERVQICFTGPVGALLLSLLEEVRRFRRGLIPLEPRCVLLLHPFWPFPPPHLLA